MLLKRVGKISILFRVIHNFNFIKNLIFYELQLQLFFDYIF